MASQSDESNFPSSMNIQDLLDISTAEPEECATSLPNALGQGTVAANRENALDQTVNYEDPLATKIATLVDSKAFTDVTLLIGEEKVEMKAHKLILALASPVFTAMFYSEFANTDSGKPNDTPIEIPDCTSGSFEALLQFIYKGVQPSLTVNDALSLLYTSRKYAVRGLEDMCCVVLSSSIAADNVFDILYAATFYNLTALDYQCWEFMEGNPVEVLNSHLEYLTHETIGSLLKSDRLNASEAELFKIMMKWAAQECAKQELEFTPDKIRQLCSEELKMIRFPAMSGQEFADVVVPTNVLTVEEVAKIFTIINSSEEKKVLNDTEFCAKKRIPKPYVNKRPDTPRPPVFSFIAQQIRESGHHGPGTSADSSGNDPAGLPPTSPSTTATNTGGRNR
ncbi:unnamed protein product [Orchesella dallaii]|uniref:BTB domain-containing protein n=1 Tax=Orchesella dallaii TaxID=48710 RepID=A0ABP1S5J0_9HEXA